MTYGFMTWKEEVVWTAHCPSIPGVYGLGRTKAKARMDLVAAAEELFGYLLDIGEKPPKAKPMDVGTMVIR